MDDPRDGARFSRLLIVRLSSMGDVIHTLPAAQALRMAFPSSMIGWLVEERWAELLCAPGTPLRGPRSAQRPLVDWVHTVNLVGWRKSLFSLHTAQNVARHGTMSAPHITTSQSICREPCARRFWRDGRART